MVLGWDGRDSYREGRTKLMGVDVWMKNGANALMSGGPNTHWNDIEQKSSESMGQKYPCVPK